MRIDRDEARRVAALARLALAEDELDRMADEMSEILSYVAQLSDFDHETPAGTAASATSSRPDVAAVSLPREPVAANAPAWKDGFFVVPRVISE